MQSNITAPDISAAPNILVAPDIAAHVIDRAALSGPAAAEKLRHRVVNAAYTHYTWYFVGAFIALVALCQFASYLVGRLQRAHPLPPQVASINGGTRTTATTTPKPALRRLPLGLLNAYRVLAFRTTLTLPLFNSLYTLNLAEVFCTLAYITGLYVLEFYNAGNKVTGVRFDATFWGNRAGLIATAQLPLVTVLGTKNNVLSWITGISYDKLNYLHRMSARTVFVLLWVHAGQWIHTGIDDDLPTTWLRHGIAGLAAFSLIILVSLRPVRERSYELFFWVHLFGVFVFLLGGYYHTSHFKGINAYVLTAFGIWAFDRATRLVRVVVYNHAYFSPFALFTYLTRSKSSPSPTPDTNKTRDGSTQQTTSDDAGNDLKNTFDATTELLSPHLIRLRLRRPPHFHWRAGQAAYLLAPGVSRVPFEAHPFTIASFESRLVPPSASSSENSSATDLEKRSGGSSRDGHDGQEKDDSRQGQDDDSKPSPYWRELVFLISVRSGFTARLASVASRRGTVKVLVDGPYGPSPGLTGDDVCVLVCGGTGVSYALPVLLDVIECAKMGKTQCRRVVFIWAIRDASHVNWIASTLASALVIAPPTLDVAIHVHVTTAPRGGLDAGSWYADSIHEDHEDHDAPEPEEREEPESEKRKEPENEKREEPESDPEKRASRTSEPRASRISELDAVNVVGGRPDLEALLREEVDAAPRGSRMSVSVCGSQSIANSVRRALRFPVSSPASVMRGGPSVSLHVESFGYA